MNMLVERGRVPITPANDEHVKADRELVSDHDINEYEQIRREAYSVNVFEWQLKQLEVAAVMGLGPPRSL